MTFHFEAEDHDCYFAADAITRASGLVQVFVLKSGRYATSGLQYEIDDDKDCYGKRVVFDSREDALRAAVARFIRKCRRASTRSTIRGVEAAGLIKWAQGLIRRRTGLGLLDWGMD